MHCPSCDHPTYHPAEPCPRCQFSGDPALIEELAHIDWVLTEIDSWQTLNDADRRQIEQTYITRQRELEIALGLRLPPFTEAEARDAWPELFQRETLLQQVAGWLDAGLVNPVTTQTLADQVNHQVDELLEQLEGHPRPPSPQTDSDRLERANFLLEAIDYLSQNQGFVSPQAEAQARSPLLAEKEDLEIKLGLRPVIEPTEKQPGEPAGRPISELKAQPGATVRGQQIDISPAPPPLARRPPAPLPPRSPAPPPLRERLWRTLLSERTLQALLVLGIFLLFTAAISFVVWGWQDFSAPLRVAIPTGFTTLFFILGWYVRTKTPLHRSGIALSAIAALLIPIDFYTIYANFNIPPDYWPQFWLFTSLFCLVAYVPATLIIRSRFFGYLVGVAAGSTVLALIEIAHQTFGLATDWRTTGLSALALGLIVLAKIFDYFPHRQLYLFAGSFRYLSVLAAGVIMPLTFGWRYLGRDTYDTLHYALTANWWLGGLIFGWGAIHYRSRSLGLLAAIALPIAVYLAQAAIFDRSGVNPAWHAFGLALLVPLYFVTGHKLLLNKDDPIIHGHGRTATGWGVALLVIAALWSLTDITGGGAAAGSHTVLTGAVILAALLWRKPTYLYAASLLSLSATTFAMTELDLSLSQLSLGWASLAIAHIVVALNVSTRFPLPIPNFAGPLVRAGYVIAALALLPPLFPYDGHLLAYALGNWLGLATWGARLHHVGQPGFAVREPKRKSIFHWLAALPLPVWLWLLFTNRRPPDFNLPLALAVLAWGMVLLSYRLGKANALYRSPWSLTGTLVSILAPLVAFLVVPDGLTPALTLLAAGLLYFGDAVTRRQSGELAPAGLVTAWGYLLLLNRLRLSFDASSFALAILIAIYFLAGLWTERRSHQARRLKVKGWPVEGSKAQPAHLQPAHLQPVPQLHTFLQPLYLTAHLLTLYLLWRIYVRPFDRLLFDVPWTDPMRLWGAAAQLLLAIVYGLYAWNTCKERWGHVAAWLGAAGGGFIAITYNTGRGSSAAKVALMAIVFVLAERGLYRLRRRPGVRNRTQALLRLAWRLYQRPLLAAGWVVSAIAIGLALIRNLWLLGGGRVQQIWAVAGLLLITSIYSLAARLFRQARFVWLAALLVFAPWTILTNLGWFTVYRPTVPGFALSWVLLAWALFWAGLILSQFAARPYVLPLKSVALVLLPFSLLWGVANVDTGRFTFGLAIAWYALAAALDYRRSKAGAKIPALGFTKYLYPALGLIPVWSVYLVAWLLPTARHEHYGLMLLIFGPLGLVAGQWLKRIAPHREMGSDYALPAYLTGYVSVIAGTTLVAHESALLGLVLLFDALLLLVSARLFKNPLWVYPAAAIVPVSLLLALHNAAVPGNRHGWWLTGLASVYLALSWLLRRRNLAAYATATLTVGLALVALGLPPSSQDQIGAMWGYGGAALVYAITAFWLRQPLLLTPAGALAVVPYAVGLQRSTLAPEYYGLALFPGAVAALALGRWLDNRFGRWSDFPWRTPLRWPVALAGRLLGWWGLPLYALGFGLAMASPFFTDFKSGRSALNFLLLMPLFGWAIYRFRLRVWLLALALAGHLAAVYFLDALGWWRYPAWAWLRFLPVTSLAALTALFIEKYRLEGTPLALGRVFWGWSRPLYLLAALDVVAAQSFSLQGSWAAAMVTLTHALLIAVLAGFWLSRWMPYASLTLGTVALLQWLSVIDRPFEALPVALARLALGYGVIGYWLAFVRNHLDTDRRLRPWLAIWELPLQRAGVALSFGVLVLTGWLGLDLAGWTIRAMLGFPFRQIVELATVQMVVGVLALLGLLYLTAALAHRRVRLGYVAIGMLLAAWTLQAFYVAQWGNLQWYAIPAGLYLLGIAYLEWRQGNKTLGRWLDYSAIVLMMGSLFWQTLLFGWGYALLLGTEGLSAFWWGSARRLRRFLYAGMVGVILATTGQLINSLRSINQWIVFGAIGMLLVIIAVIIERKLEDIKTWQEKLETWE